MVNCNPVNAVLVVSSTCFFYNFREREKQLEELRSLHEEETSQARATMEEYRSSFESKTSKLFTEMKSEVKEIPVCGVLVTCADFF